jgi:cation diffusion facilitator family transporter
MGKRCYIDNAREVRRVLVVTLALNSAVAATKIIYGLLTGSISITSDGFHSMFDGVSNIFGLVGIWISSRPPDKNHPYGHKKYETLFTVIISVMIFATCLQILKKVYLSFMGAPPAEVTPLSFAVMFITMGVNIFVSKYEGAQGRALKSDFLVADSMHTKSDILSTSAVIAGLIFMKLGHPIADGLAGLVVAMFIAKIGYEILRKSADVLVDTVSINTSLIEKQVMKVEGVKGCHDIRTRGSESATYVDLHVLVDPALPVERAHEIADKVEEMICHEFPFVVDVVVHIEPEGNG